MGVERALCHVFQDAMCLSALRARRDTKACRGIVLRRGVEQGRNLQRALQLEKRWKLVQKEGKRLRGVSSVEVLPDSGEELLNLCVRWMQGQAVGDARSAHEASS